MKTSNVVKALGALFLLAGLSLLLLLIITDMKQGRRPLCCYPRWDNSDYLIMFAPLFFFLGLAVIFRARGKLTRLLRRIVLILVVGLLVSELLNAVTKSTSFQFFGELVNHVETNRKVIALTYESSHQSDTLRLLDVLSRYQARATFFIIGRDVETHPELVRSILDSGDEVGNLSYSHTRMILENPSFIRAEIEKTDGLLRQSGVTGEIHFRAPYGRKLFVLPYVLSEMRKKNIMWDVNPRDYETNDPQAIAEYVTAHAHAGAIVALHDRAQTLAATEIIIRNLQEQGYTFVTVSELLSQKAN